MSLLNANMSKTAGRSDTAGDDEENRVTLEKHPFQLVGVILSGGAIARCCAKDLSICSSPATSEAQRRDDEGQVHAGSDSFTGTR